MRSCLTQEKSARYELPAINFHLRETPPREPQGGGEHTERGCGPIRDFDTRTTAVPFFGCPKEWDAGTSAGAIGAVRGSTRRACRTSPLHDVKQPRKIFSSHLLPAIRLFFSLFHLATSQLDTSQRTSSRSPPPIEGRAERRWRSDACEAPVSARLT
jgi:hypothetical protein